ncbi:MAG: MlaE family lipid ABC transporter permease subunit [Verrucomicrobiota bacterium]|jgi:phospholipid/cholesterol/gamma-HCH transport system permease protein|nr:MlaE family lipid ABC transporter permease subunit [Verrucomicrobiota bacterium]
MVNAIQELGAKTTRFIEELGRIAVFIWLIVRAVFRPPPRIRPFIDEVFKVGVMSLVIICVSGVAVGAVLGLQGYNTLVRFGATESLGAAVGLVLFRELGPVLTALLFIGRAGSSTTAEIGTMVATEQLDGLRMMAVDPIHYVVTPKALAMLFVMPLLSSLFILFGLGGGYLVGAQLMGVDPGSYISSLQNAIVFKDDILSSLIKALTFGCMVGVISTFEGYSSAPTSSGVSRATTASVVVGSVSVLIVDYLLTALMGV